MITFYNWVDGDMLNARDGVVEGRSLHTTVSVKAAPEAKIEINCVPATFDGKYHTAPITLSQYETRVCARDTKTGEQAEMLLYWLPDFAGKYRVSLDDNIWFLRELAEHDYSSIFECAYLAFWKELYDEFGTKTHINIYLKDDDDFTIAALSDRYKAEWQANSHWLRLSFHARANLPAQPYLNAGYDEMKRDVDAVRAQIERFAGKELLGPVTTLHWGDATVEGCRALRDAGYDILLADFNPPPNNYPVAYYLTSDTERLHLFDRFAWRDTKEDITFIRCAIIANCYQEEEIVPFLDQLARDPHRGAFIDLLIHEQYFFPHYQFYQPNYRDKMRTAVRWAVENGYEPAFLEEIAAKW